MDLLPGENGVSVADRVQKREDFRALISDVGDLAETQRTALLLREIDDLSYDEIAQAMDTTVPAVKSLLVRARMSLADATQGRKLTCDEVTAEPRRGRRRPAQGDGRRALPHQGLRALPRVPRPTSIQQPAAGCDGPDRHLGRRPALPLGKLGIGGAKVGAGSGAAGGTASAGAGCRCGAGDRGAGAAAAGASRRGIPSRAALPGSSGPRPSPEWRASRSSPPARSRPSTSTAIAKASRPGRRPGPGRRCPAHRRRRRGRQGGPDPSLRRRRGRRLRAPPPRPSSCPPRPRPTRRRSGPG